jgi:RimJ/RimL family protein N-acetyltransferase
MYVCGDKVTLRSVKLSDANIITKWKKDHFIKHMALDHDSKITLKNQRNDIKQAIESHNQIYLMITPNNGTDPIGYIRLNWMDNRKTIAWLRFALGEARGKGFGKDALSALLKHLFLSGLHRIEAETYEYNEKSINLLKYLGFKIEGVKRKAHFDGNNYRDILVFGLLKEDFI